MSDDIGYMPSGAKVLIVGRCEDRYIVRRIIVVPDIDGDREVVQTRERVVRTVYKEPPVQLFDPAIEESKKQLQTAHAELSRMRGELQQVRSERDKLLTALQDFQALKRIEAFITGKFTHFVVIDGSYSLKVLAFTEIVSSDDERACRQRKRMRLLTLFGETNGDLQWKINSSHDDQGNWCECVPCESAADATQVAAQKLQAWSKELQAADMKNTDTPWKMQRVLASYKQCGFELPRWMQIKVQQNELNRQREELSKYRAKSEELMRSISEIEYQLMDR